MAVHRGAQCQRNSKPKKNSSVAEILIKEPCQTFAPFLHFRDNLHLLLESSLTSAFITAGYNDWTLPAVHNDWSLVARPLADFSPEVQQRPRGGRCEIIRPRCVVVHCHWLFLSALEKKSCLPEDRERESEQSREREREQHNEWHHILLCFLYVYVFICDVATKCRSEFIKNGFYKINHSELWMGVRVAYILHEKKN